MSRLSAGFACHFCDAPARTMRVSSDPPADRFLYVTEPDSEGESQPSCAGHAAMMLSPCGKVYFSLTR